MKYTSSKKADKKIEQDLNLIVKEILKKDSKIISIILTGGFGRGEGPVKETKDKIILYNDYDLQVVSQTKISKEEVDELSGKISKKLGFSGIVNFYPFEKEKQKIKDNFYLDIKFYTIKELKNLLPRVRTYEFKNDSTVVYGKDIRNIIPNYNLNEIPLSEGIKFVLDRMSHLIEYYSVEKNYDREFLTYSICQAYSAICTALLMFSRKYEIGYEKSAEIFSENYKKDFIELYKKIPELDKRIKKYVSWRLNPKKPEVKNLEEEWKIVARDILEVAKYLLSKFLNKKIETTEDLSNAILSMREKFYAPYVKDILEKNLGFSNDFLIKSVIPFVSFVLKYKFYNRLKKRKIENVKIFFNKSPDLIIYGSAPFILNSVLEKEIDNEILKRGQDLLKKIYPTKSKNWEKISVEYANAYISFFLQKI